MRLIDASRLTTPQPPTFIEVDNPESIDYAILSHRWEPHEFTYQDAMLPSNVFLRHSLFQKPGYVKLFRFAEVAWSSYQIQYVWMDTCCIDKTNLAELTESINSMYRWYKESKYCLAYLADWTPESDQAFTESLWFTRCWTLQELIAPSKVIFLDKSWRTDIRWNKENWAEQISLRTRIDPAVLKAKRSLSDVSIAQRMSWVAGRRASKLEDEAYCLLGIFDVSMPMLYGEGRRAFLRLQEEIIERNPDQSIFVWSSITLSNNLLASSSEDFMGSDGVRQVPLHKRPFALNNLGLEIELELRQIRGNTYAGYLACENRTPDNQVTLVLELEPGTTYLRRRESCLSQAMEQHSRVLRKRRKIIILRKVSDKYLDIPVPLYGFRLGGKCKSFVLVNDFDYGRYWDLGRWRTDERVNAASPYPIFQIPEGESTSIATMILFIGKTRLLIQLMFDFDFRPCCYISKHTHSFGNVFQIRSSGDLENENKMAWLDQETGWIQNENGRFVELGGGLHPYTEQPAWAVKSVHREGFTASIPRDLIPRDFITKRCGDIKISFSPHQTMGDWVFDVHHELATSQDLFRDLDFPIVSGTHDLGDLLYNFLGFEGA